MPWKRSWDEYCPGRGAETNIALEEELRRIIALEEEPPRISAPGRGAAELVLPWQRRISFPEFFTDPYIDLEHLPGEASLSKGCKYAELAVRLRRPTRVPGSCAHVLCGLGLSHSAYHFRSSLPIRTLTWSICLCECITQ